MKKEFKQQIVDVSQLPDKVVVRSSSGNEYPVILSNELRDSGKEIRENDWGIVHRIYGKFYLHDVEPTWRKDL